MKDEQKKFWGTVIERVILNLSDQQLLTGIAILVLGLIKHCTVSVYHFTVISDLAWFSSYVHMTSLILLQDYLRDRPQLPNWRVSLMLVMLNLLMAYTIIEGPTGRGNRAGASRPNASLMTLWVALMDLLLYGCLSIS